MKQIWPNYSYSPATNVLTLTGLNIDRDQLLLVTAADRGRIMYNFADSSVTASAFTSGANTSLTLVATTAGLTTTAALVIYYDDQLASNSVTVSSLPAISGTVTANVLGKDANSTATPQIPIIAYDEGIAAANDGWVVPVQVTNVGGQISEVNPLPISGTVTIGSALPAGTNRIGVVTIGGGTVTIGAGTAQIGSVTASLAYSQTATTIASTVVTAIPVVFPTSGAWGGSLQGYNGTNTYIYSGIQAIGNTSLVSATSLPVSLGSLPALAAGTAQIGSVTVGNSVTIGSLPAISGTVTANTFALQGTAVTTSNFTSTTASTVLANYNATREVLTVFNEGAGNLHICAGATCTTIAYQVRLSAGDYYEVPNHQTTITHSAVFATAGTARIVQIS